MDLGKYQKFDTATEYQRENRSNQTKNPNPKPLSNSSILIQV